jgi:ankyrin repeat protein
MRTSLLLAVGSLLLGTPVFAQNAQSRLWDAAIAGDTLAIRQALADGADVDALDTRTNTNGRRALNWAAWHDRVAAIEVLLAAGATLEAENNTGFTPLHHAAEAGSLDAARALLAAGADPNHSNKAGRLPVETARARGNDEVASLLEAPEAGED